MSHASSGGNPAAAAQPELTPEPQLAALTQATRERRHAVDALLPAPSPVEPEELSLTVSDDDGRLVAVATSLRTQPDAGSLELTWGRADQHRLSSVRVGGHQPGMAMDWLLTAWLDELATLDQPPGEDSAAIVTVPSRDPVGVPALQGHGLQPLSVIAARTAGRLTPSRPRLASDSRVEAESELRVRAAEPADHPAVTALHMAEIRYDAQFGSVIERPFTADRIAELIGGLLQDPDPWVWIAERGDRPVGIALVSPPSRAGWIAPLAAAEPVAYLDCLSVSAEERGTGVGSALVDHVHRRLDDVGIAVTLLHYGSINPLSGPFWSRMGYRPLWTSWQAQPATALR